MKWTVNNKILCKQKNRWQIAPDCLQGILLMCELLQITVSSCYLPSQIPKKWKGKSNQSRHIKQDLPGVGLPAGRYFRICSIGWWNLIYCTEWSRNRTAYWKRKGAWKWIRILQSVTRSRKRSDRKEKNSSRKKSF